MSRYLLGPYALSSSLGFPELARLGSSSDTLCSVTLQEGSVAPHLEGSREVAQWCHATQRQALIVIPEIGRFLVGDDLTVTVELDRPARPDGLWRAFFLGPVLNVLCFMSGYLALHACALVLENRAILLGGRSGQGKSTIAAGLRRVGLKMLSDDLSIVAWDSRGTPTIYPAYPTARLWSDTLEYLETSTDQLMQVYRDRPKFLVPTTEEFHDRPVPVARVYQLCTTEDDSLLTLERKSGLDAVTRLIAMTHRGFLLPGLGYEQTNFRQCSSFAEHVEVYSLARRWGLEHLAFTANAIVEAGV